MKDTQNKKREGLIFALCLAAVLVLCALPLVAPGLSQGGDSDTRFHLLRLEAMAREMAFGRGWPAYVYSFMAGGYGYGVGLFYPDLLLAPFAWLHSMGLGLALSFKCYLLFTCLLLAVGCYFAGRAITQSPQGGLVVMVLYTLCQYHCFNVYVRNAAGELQGQIFVPLVFWGLWDLTENGFKKPWVLCAAFTGLLLSHTISLALCGILALGWVLVRLPRVLKKETIAKALGCVAVCLGVGAFYWLPMLEQFLSDTYRVSYGDWVHLQDCLLNRSWTVLPNYTVSVGTSLLVALALCGGCLVLAVLQKGVWAALKENRFPLVLLALGGVLIIITIIGVLPWEKLDETFISAIQFPWRLNLLSQFCFSLAAALLLVRTGPLPGRMEKHRARLAPAVLALLLAAGGANLWFIHQVAVPYVLFPDTYFVADRIQSFDLVAAEWLPSGADTWLYKTLPAAEYYGPDGAPQTGRYNADGSFSFDYTGAAGSYRTPKIFYAGYAAKLAPADGSAAILLDASKSEGLTAVTLDEALPAGTVTVWYEGTVLQRVACRMSLATLLLLAVAGIQKRYGAILRRR